MSVQTINRKSSWRRAVVALACWLVVLQTFFAGLHAAELSLPADETLLIICHSGDAPADNSTGGGKDSSVRLLCGLCALAAGTTLLPASPPFLAAPIAVAAPVHMLRRDTVAVAVRPPRAGLARAPPPFA